MDEMTDNKTMIIAAAILMVVAALIRYPCIGEQSYWLDEIVSINLASRPVGEILIAEDGFPPLYALMVKALGPEAADNFSVRKLSALFGVLSVGMILWLGFRFYGLRTGIFSALLLTLSPLHVWYSREGRMYALMVLLSILSSMLIRELTEKGKWGARALYFVITLVGILTHYVYAGMVAAQFIYLSTRLKILKIQLRWLVILFTGIMLLGLALFPVVKEAIIHWPLGPPREFRIFSIPYTIFTFVAGFGIGPPLEDLHRYSGLSAVSGYWPEVLLVLFTGVLAGAAGLQSFYRDKTPGLRLYLLLWLMVPPAMALLISWTTGAGYNVRYSITALPAFILAAGLGLARHGRLSAFTGLAFLIIVSFISISRDRFDPRYARENIRAASDYLEWTAEKDDRIFSSTMYVYPVLEHYYKGPQKIEPLPVRPVKTREDAYNILKMFKENKRRNWLVMSRDWEEDPKGYLTGELAKNRKSGPAAQFPGVAIYVFEK